MTDGESQIELKEGWRYAHQRRERGERGRRGEGGRERERERELNAVQPLRCEAAAAVSPTLKDAERGETQQHAGSYQEFNSRRRRRAFPL